MKPEYGLPNSQAFYTYYTDTGLVFLGIQLPAGVVYEPFPIGTWVRMLDEERAKALNHFTPVPRAIAKAFDDPVM